MKKLLFVAALTVVTTAGGCQTMQGMMYGLGDACGNGFGRGNGLGLGGGLGCGGGLGGGLFGRRGATICEDCGDGMIVDDGYLSEMPVGGPVMGYRYGAGSEFIAPGMMVAPGGIGSAEVMAPPSSPVLPGPVNNGRNGNGSVR